MNSSYYDIDDILADNQKLPCKFQMTVPGLGYLEGNPGKPLRKNSKLELPLWLAEVLAIIPIDETSEDSFIELVQPEYFSNRVINAIKTNSKTLDLHSISTYYYKLAIKWCAMFKDKELAEVISEMLKDRSSEINDFATNSKNGNSSGSHDFILSLDEFEKKLFKLSHDSNRNFKNWIQQ
ncbi:hypothetical protein PACTADRAFT_38769 [Pachysolen tannophilus NRRL Y-2460]|uniref:DNA replication complex GINS protein PSF3 n=1 Tax=Pachysolen tannophilus NRRL Y-2460 TaxID=669874 RepID=A0A1E4TZY7_PACTA|nr:hypothetical protein PACTADRAFT_38769 [Pachysolen tannophilus NRRL Y-2460]